MSSHRPTTSLNLTPSSGVRVRQAAGVRLCRLTGVNAQVGPRFCFTSAELPLSSRGSARSVVGWCGPTGKRFHPPTLFSHPESFCRRLRPSHANVRSTIQRLAMTSKPTASFALRTTSIRNPSVERTNCGNALRP